MLPFCSPKTFHCVLHSIDGMTQEGVQLFEATLDLTKANASLVLASIPSSIQRENPPSSTTFIPVLTEWLSNLFLTLFCRACESSTLQEFCFAQNCGVHLQGGRSHTVRGLECQGDERTAGQSGEAHVPGRGRQNDEAHHQLPVQEQRGESCPIHTFVSCQANLGLQQIQICMAARTPPLAANPVFSENCLFVSPRILSVRMPCL